MKQATHMLRLILLILAVASFRPALAQPANDVSYQVFYDELSAYGQWVDDPQYGYVWVPDVARDFRPYYTNGYWIMTAYGNTWYSDYPWGWAPFHYGRWTYDSYYGWVWVPGYEWAPAWVCWRHGYGYYGWAPLTPGFSIAISFSSYWCPVDWWIFVPPHYIHDRHFHHHWSGPRRNDDIVRHTTIINNTHTSPGGSHFRYPSGPGANEIQTETGRPVPVFQMNDLSRPGMSVVTDNAMSIYRPEIAADRNTGITPPRQAIKAPQPLDKPASMSVNADRDPGFRTAHPRSSIPTQPERAPAQRPVEDRPMRPSEPRPPVIERPQQNPQQDRPVKRNQDDIYNNAPIRQQEHVPNPVRRPTPEQPRYEQPRQDRPQYNRPVERPLPPPQPQRQEQPRQLPQRNMPSPQPGNQAPVRRPAGSQ